MTRKILQAISVFLLMTALSGPTHGAELTAMEKIASQDTDAQIEGLDEILKNRRNIIDDLKTTLKTSDRNGNDPEQFSIIILINALGELRAVEAIPVLIDYIEYIPTPTRTHPSGIPPAHFRLSALDEQYAAVRALIDIGNPSIPLVLEEMATTDSMVAILNSGWVIHQIEGPKVTIIRLKEKLGEITDSTKRERIENLISNLSVGAN